MKDSKYKINNTNTMKEQVIILNYSIKINTEYSMENKASNNICFMNSSFNLCFQLNVFKIDILNIPDKLWKEKELTKI